MGTEVLRPQDCLIQRIRGPPSPAVFSRRRNFNYYNYYPNNTTTNNSSYNNNFQAISTGRSTRKPVIRPERYEQKKRVERRPPSSDDSRVPPARGNGTVKILRRGESLDSNIRSEALRKEGGDLVVVGTQRLGPDPNMVPRRIRIADLAADVYAGSAFSVSPSPSALPLPSFGKKQLQRPSPAVAVAVDDSATRDLRRLLRLE
ncbi:hypothetical protein HN51_003685 [Arachis hypogaea]|uniref:Uncharacterized protein n=1 Tax=Arachis hypogaea TaxID=3818 RepID=A0A445DJY1_ARAHY|nr:uncharacterized protein LOC112795806 [Arachis hypogaea]QHO37203.1 uncharacterized protein DS421_4g109480 [Arachis hypogaea]RYR63527.1 hypothetical protein Ahy_A04g021342 [Arachis hypogaea]